MLILVRVLDLRGIERYSQPRMKLRKRAKVEAIDERKSKVVELRYFGGLTVEEVAEVLKVSTITVMRDWAFAKAWLSREMQNGQ